MSQFSLQKNILFIGLLFLSLLSQAQDKIAIYKKVADNIVNSYNEKDFKKIRQNFSGAVKLVLNKKQTNIIFSDLYEQGGKIINMETPLMEDTAKMVIPLLFEKDSLQLNMVLRFNTQNKLTGLGFKSPNKIKYPKVTDTTSVDDIAQPFISRKKNVGLTIGTYSYGEKHFFNYGQIIKGTGIVPDSNTIYEIGSITKVFTSIILADLVEKKIINYNDPISKFLPDSIPRLKYKNKEIKLIDLATHTSGLPAIPENLEETMKDSLNPYANYTLRDLYSYLKNVKLERTPGKQYEYSNLGMGLLGEILINQLQMTFEEATKKIILNKLDMQNTTIHLTEKQKSLFAKGYNEKGDPTPYWDLLTLQGAGALRSNAADMIKFLEANIEHDETGLTEVINKAQIKRTKETALGWHLLSINNNKIYLHNGGTYGFSSFIGFNLEKKIGVVLLANSGNSVDEMGILILELLLNRATKTQ